ALPDGRCTVAGADLLVPDDFQPVLGPGRNDTLFRGHAGAERTEEARPIIAHVGGYARGWLLLLLPGLRGMSATNDARQKNNHEHAHDSRPRIASGDATSVYGNSDAG